jgi:hypothetical protein
LTLGHLDEFLRFPSGGDRVVSELDRKMVGVLCIALLLFALALFNLMTQNTKTVREGDVLTVRMERSIWGEGVPVIVIKKGKLEPSLIDWTYHILFEELGQDSIHANVTYFDDGKYRREDSGKLTLKQSHQTNLTFIMIQINDIDSQQARVRINLR